MCLNEKVNMTHSEGWTKVCEDQEDTDYRKDPYSGHLRVKGGPGGQITEEKEAVTL